MMQPFGGHLGDLNPLGHKDSIGQPSIEGCASSRCPARDAQSRRRRIHGIQTFNVLRGEYLVMPNLSALNWIADLDQPDGTGQPIT
jgi:hypothetical protein